MVYFGPSRGCWTCKRRRKKCDEVKPACMRCINGKRTCGGYAEPSALIFRPGYSPNSGLDLYSDDSSKSQPVASLARKCTLAKRMPIPGTDIYPPDVPPKEISPDLFNEYAVRTFLWDFCIQPTTLADARGLFRGLEPILLRQGLNCMVGKAAMAVAGEHHRTVLNREYLGMRGHNNYVEVVGYLAKAIQNPRIAKSPETLLIATLLGLYEMMRQDGSGDDLYNPHSHGVSAILQIGNEPTDLIHAARSGHFWEMLTGTSQPCSILTFPSQNMSTQSMDDLALIYKDVYAKSMLLLREPTEHTKATTTDLYALLEEATALDQAFSQWNDAQPQDFRPSVCGNMHRYRRSSFSAASTSSATSHAASTCSSSPPPLSESSPAASTYSAPSPPSYLYGTNGPPSTVTPAAGFWPGRLDTYHDPYIASVWNVYRSARLVLIDIILQISDLLDQRCGQAYIISESMRPARAEHKEAGRILVEDLLASIPFHLVENLHVFIRDAAAAGGTLQEIPNPGRPVGGLLLMHHIESASRLSASLVDADVHDYLKRCLLWISTEMGIGQAGVFARSSSRLDYLMSSSWMIIGVAMLL